LVDLKKRGGGVGWESVTVQRIPQKRIFVPDLEKTGPWNAAETTQSRREASGFRPQASGFRLQASGLIITHK
jgi:hypothetical protein